MTPPSSGATAANNLVGRLIDFRSACRDHRTNAQPTFRYDPYIELFAGE
jgi:hypothetical protein